MKEGSLISAFTSRGETTWSVSVYVCVSRMSPPVKREWFVFIISTLQSYPNCAAAGFIIMYPGRPVGVTSGGEGGI